MADKDRPLIEGVSLNDMEFKGFGEYFGHIGDSHPATNHGTVVAIASEDPETGRATWVAKLPPGWRSSGTYFHNILQEKFLLEGDLTTAGKRHEAPTYFCWPPNHVHGPEKTENGATLLLIWHGRPHLDWDEYYKNRDWPDPN